MAQVPKDFERFLREWGKALGGGEKMIGSVVEKRLQWLALSDGFDIRHDVQDEGGYVVYHKNEPLRAYISAEGDIKYYRSDAYNSGVGLLEINVKKVDDLRKFCELLLSED